MDPRTGVTAEDLCNEVKRVKDIKYEHVCKVYGYSLVGNTAVRLVLEYVDGGIDLGKFLAQNSPLDLQTQFELCIQAAMALDYIHTYTPLLHRDVKAENFLLRGTKLLLADFGLTKEGFNVGNTSSTLNWSAPEVLGEEVHWTSKADIYSLGMVFFEIISGHIPFAEFRINNPIQFSKRVIQGLRPTIPQSCNQVLRSYSTISNIT